MWVSPLSGKTHIPQLRPSYVSRGGLLNRLFDAVLQPGQIILVSRSAGFGKATLLSEFSHQTYRRVAWVSLDAGENDPIQVWNYDVTALEHMDTEMGRSTLALLQTPRLVLEENISVLLIDDLDHLQNILPEMQPEFPKQK